jgi:nucleotide-binding universal stress UspA family protein
MKESKIKFLVPIAFSSQSEIILEQACSLAKTYDAEVTLLYVLDLTKAFGLFTNPEEQERVKQNAEEKFSQLVEATSKNYEIEVNSIIVEGRAYETIIAVAKSLNSNVIIMGATGATGLKSQFIGTNTMKVVKQAHCPVITIRGREHRKGCKNIVLPLDLTKETTQKIEYAISFAKMFKGATIRAVSVLWTNDDKIIKKLTSQMVKVKEEIQQSGVKCTAELVRIIKEEESFADTIIAYAEKVNGDIIMIMTQEESNPTEFFIGSSAQTVISKSLIPVMSILPRGSKALNLL